MPKQTAKNFSVAIVRNSWHKELVDSLEEDAISVLKKAGVRDVETITVPGCFEIPLACSVLLKKKRKPDGILALGLVIEGETHHARLIAESCTYGLLQLQLTHGVPITHGVLYVRNRKQAEERTRGAKARGRELAEALLAMMRLLRGGTH